MIEGGFKALASGTIVPHFVYRAVKTLQEKGYAAWVVGGALRDYWLGLKAKDWDVATDALPQEVMNLFEKAIPTGIKFGTVTVVLDGNALEITTFRQEKNYTPQRKPGQVKLGVTLEEDFKRRDFTVNALAYDPVNERWYDPYYVIPKLEGKLMEIKAVGDPCERFEEDPLRMLRAFYLMARAGEARAKVCWDEATLKAISLSRDKILRVSAERIRDELNKILLGSNPDECLRKMQQVGLLEVILPEVSRNHGVIQGDKTYKLDVFEHILAVVRTIKPSLHLRWAALLHDVGKFSCRKEEGEKIHFYGHEKVSVELARLALERLKFSQEFKEKVLHLISHHLFSYPTTPAGLRRFLRRVGPEAVEDLLELRRADILGTDPEANLLALEEFSRRLEEIRQKKAAFSLKDLAINGYDVMECLNLSPGPAVGKALNYLLERVLEDPSLNTRETLLRELKEWAGAHLLQK